MALLLDDLRQAFRSLLRTPGFTATAVLILALGIGANAALFGLVDGVLLRPLPYPDPDRLVAVWGQVKVEGRETNPLSAPDFLDWQRDAGQLEGLAAMNSDEANLTGGGEPQIVPVARVTWNFFQVVGVRPALGRDFRPEEDRAGGPRAAILSYGFWQRRFGGDPGLLGRTIRLDGLDTPVVGILPEGFRYEHRIRGSEIYLPAAFTPVELANRGSHFLGAVGRLKPGATPASCRKDLEMVAARLAAAYPDTNRNFSANVLPLKEQVVRASRGTLLVLMGAVAFVLLIAAANLMNLTLARAARRQREMAIRAALGAGPWILVRAALAESLLLGLMGGGAGLLVALWTRQGLVALLGASVAGGAPAPSGPRTMVFALLLSLATALLIGLLPALKARGDRPADHLKEGKGAASSSHPRLRGILVASETALATALLIGAGLMLRTLVHLAGLDLGFRPDHLLVTRITMPPAKYPDSGSREAFLTELRRRLEASPGVVAAGLNDTAPLMRSDSTSSYDVAGQDTPDGQQALNHHTSPGYFRAMGIPLLRGRDLLPGESGAVVVNEAFARRHFPQGDPLAGRVSFDRATEPFLPIVGVVGSVRQDGPADEIRAEMYFPLDEARSGGYPVRSYVVAVRAAADPAALVPVLRQALNSLDPDIPLGDARPMTEVLSRDLQGAQARSILLGAFAGLALLLAGVGTYAVVHFLTALRTREIGVRMAMGAQVRDVLRLVLVQGLRMVLPGVALGAASALALSRVLQSQVAGVRPWDPPTFATVLAVLALTGLAACLVPAARAARVDPLVALRDE